MNFTSEMLMKAKEARTAEELIALAKENNIEASEEEIRAYFEANNKTGEISDDELDNVAGGGCGSDDESSGPKEYVYPPHVYTNGCRVTTGNTACTSILGNPACMSGNAMTGHIYFDGGDKWHVVCDSCGGIYHGSGSPKGGVNKFYPV